MTKITPSALKEILRLHALWVANEADGERASLENIDLTGVVQAPDNPWGVDLRGVNLMMACLDGANLSGANLQGINLHGADLRRVNFDGADLTGAGLRKASLEGATFRKARLDGADLTHATMMGAVFTHASLRKASINHANLNGAEFWRADLFRICAIESDLRGADLRRADLLGADLKGADLRGANLDLISWPLWCGSMNVRVDRDIAAQMAYHFCTLKCDDHEFQMAKQSLTPFANTFKRCWTSPEGRTRDMVAPINPTDTTPEITHFFVFPDPEDGTNGRIYTDHGVTRVNMGSIPEAADCRSGRCYDLSQRFQRDNPTWTRVHAVIFQPCGVFAGTPYPHAFVENDGVVFDPVFACFYPLKEYYHIYRVTDPEKFDSVECG